MAGWLPLFIEHERQRREWEDEDDEARRERPRPSFLDDRRYSPAEVVAIEKQATRRTMADLYFILGLVLVPTIGILLAFLLLWLADATLWPHLL